MSVIIGIFLLLFLVAVAAVVVWLVWRTVAEQAAIKRTLDLVMFEIALPRDKEKSEDDERAVQEVRREKIGVIEQLLSTLIKLPVSPGERLLYGRPIIVFEIVARNDEKIVFYAGTERRYLDHLEKQIYALYPDAAVTPSHDYTLFEHGDTIKGGVVKMSKKEHLPIATYQELAADPMQSLTGALANIRDGDAAVIQFVCRPAAAKVRSKGKEAARRTIRGMQGDVGSDNKFSRARGILGKTQEEREKMEQKNAQLTPRAQERVELVERKMSQPQFEVNVRIGVAVRDPGESERVFNAISAAFSQYYLPDLNALAVRRNSGTKRFLRDLIFRVPRDSTAITLSTSELASLFHFPLPSTQTPNILWRGAKSAPASAEATSGSPETGVTIGKNVYRGVESPVYFANNDRRRHLYMIGQTGVGKTTMFLNMIVQDMQAGRGVGVVDPHGDLIEEVLLHVPQERLEDVILLDPRDVERPLGFNILDVQDGAQKDLIVNEVVQILQKLAARLNPESIGPMFEHYLRNALLALVEDEGSTLLDVPRMFVDQSFRERVLAKNIDPTVRQFWEQEFAQSQRGQMSADMLSYVISKLGRFVSNRMVRNMIGQARSSFSVREVMDEGKILLCNLSKGSLGDINSDLLGFVLVSKMQIAALSRANMPEESRKDFYLYLDEFQNFTTDSIVTILSEARKYRLNLNLTHQFVEQLEDAIREAVFGNVGTMVSYRVGPQDAEVLAKQFEPVFSEYDLVNLESYSSIVRLLVAGTPQRPFSLVGNSPPTGGDAQAAEAIRQRSRQQYGRAVVEVEQEIAQRFAYGTSGDSRSGTDDSADEDYLSESLFDVS